MLPRNCLPLNRGVIRSGIHARLAALRWLAGACVALVAAAFAASAREPDKSAPPTPDRVERLIDELGNEDYFVRERAQQELARIGIDAFDALNDAQDRHDLEIAERARYLLRLMQVDWTSETDPPEVKRLLGNYEGEATGGGASETDRLNTIEQLAALPDGKGLAALCRIVRFERSLRVAKQAAAKIIEQKFEPTAWSQRAALIRADIGRSTRSPAMWLRTYVDSHDKPSAAVGRWAKLAEADMESMREFPQQTSAQLVLVLWRQEVQALEHAHDQEKTLAAMRKMIELEPGEGESFAELLTWLVEKKAWTVIDEAAKRYADRFEQDPVLLYTLAEACKVQHKPELADELVARALKLNDQNQRRHMAVALKLKQRGLFPWAEQEFRHAIDIGPPGQADTLWAQSLLAEMLHDQGQELAAAKALEAASEAMQARIMGGRPLDEFRGDPHATRARMHYFYACHEAQAGHRAEQIKQLEKGLAEDRTDADVLIALFRIPDLEPALREKTLRLITSASEDFRRQIQQAPDTPTAYNQLAWLVANTQGDRQEALRCSQKSLELAPHEPGYLDTLGRCYFALGDYQNAVKVQSQAVALDPHSGQMNKQLALFRAELAKSEAIKAKPDEKKPADTKPADGESSKP